MMDPFGNPHGTWSGGMHPQDRSNPNSTKPTGTVPTTQSCAPTAPGGQPPHNQPILQVCAEVKPRLTKEQHEFLEGHFQQQPKPSTSTKKQFAETLGVPLDKINNWFQNRRAKVKQDRKKAMNAFALLHQHVPAPMYMPVTQPLPSSGPADFLGHNTVLPSTEFSPDALSQATGPDSRNIPAPAFSRATDFNPTVPTIMETTQPATSENIVQNLQAAGYAVQDPRLVTTSPEDPLGFGAPFNQEFMIGTNYSLSALNPLSTPFGELPQDLSQSFAFQPYMQAPVSSVPTMENGFPVVASAAVNDMPSLTAPFTIPNWSEDSTRAVTVATSTPPSELDSSNGDSINQPGENWQATQPSDRPVRHDSIYQHANPSAPVLTTPQEESGNQLETPAEAFIRRNSSTTALAESLDLVGINAHSDSETTFKHPDQPSSIAVRRQRPRPVPLGAAALRSFSTPGLPASPGANQNLAAPDQQLRRIKSSGVGNGRIQKPSTASGQRSPLSFTFADAASPKFGRHASMQSNVSSPSVSIPTSSLAPPTPNTPNDLGHWPPWQAAPSFTKSYGNNLNPNGGPVSWSGETMGNQLLVNVSSPPDTPSNPSLDSQQQAHIAYLHNPQAIFRDTPPQSAPAMQQTFSQTSSMPPSMAFSSSMPIPDEKASHLRRPSLPDGGHAVSLDTLNSMQQYTLPLFNGAGELQLSQYNMSNGVHTTSPPQQAPNLVQGFTNPFTASPGQPSVVKPDFPVHEYSPPQNGTMSPPRADSMAPKVYHFSNAGPNDYAAKQE